MNKAKSVKGFASTAAYEVCLLHCCNQRACRLVRTKHLLYCEVDLFSYQPAMRLIGRSDRKWRFHLYDNVSTSCLQIEIRVRTMWNTPKPCEATVDVSRADRLSARHDRSELHANVRCRLLTATILKSSSCCGLGINPLPSALCFGSSRCGFAAAVHFHVVRRGPQQSISLQSSSRQIYRRLQMPNERTEM